MFCISVTEGVEICGICAQLYHLISANTRLEVRWAQIPTPFDRITDTYVICLSHSVTPYLI